ncbi:DNA replication protein DnaC [Clostridiaceae bacterium]|nr:DNA replication protein DnaC [Clostridiaceae bacterium]RKI14076.1 DNA replication protein DnaC [bacterium 1XD21-70]
MALNNSQYNEVMRNYERQQLKNRYSQQSRVEEVYGRLPQIKALDDEIRAWGASLARQALGGEKGASARFKEKLQDLREQKLCLLASAGYPADYMELQYNCPDCRDTGYAQGRRCHCFEQARIRLLYTQSNISQILQKENFDTLSFAWYDDTARLGQLGMTQAGYMQMVVQNCREFAAGFPDKGKNLLFTGSTGVGKTFLTNCIAKALIDRYISVVCLTSQDLFELLSRYRFGRDQLEDAGEAFSHILDCEMLIIDDLGTEMNNTFVSSQLFYCVNERINRDKGTIISTNLSMGMLRDMYSDRVASRIMSHYATIPLYGEDIRMKKKNFRGLT